MSVEKPVWTEKIYSGRIIAVRRDRVILPNGRSSTREVVEHRPAAVIVAENDTGELLLIRQYRYPIDAVIYELPAGLVEEGEDPEQAAWRELQEETGWRPGELQRLADAYSSPGFTTELFRMFYAHKLERHSLQADDDEFIEADFYSETAVRGLLSQGLINDAKTLMGVYWWLLRKDR